MQMHWAKKGRICGQRLCARRARAKIVALKQLEFEVRTVNYGVYLISTCELWVEERASLALYVLSYSNNSETLDVWCVCVALLEFHRTSGGWYRRQYILLSILPAYLLWLGQILCWWSIDEELPHNALHAHHWSWSYSVSIQYLYTNNTRGGVGRISLFFETYRRHLIFRGGACFFLYQTHHVYITYKYNKRDILPNSLPLYHSTDDENTQWEQVRSELAQKQKK